MFLLAIFLFSEIMLNLCVAQIRPHRDRAGLWTPTLVWQRDAGDAGLQASCRGQDAGHGARRDRAGLHRRRLLARSSSCSGTCSSGVPLAPVLPVFHRNFHFL